MIILCFLRSQTISNVLSLCSPKVLHKISSKFEFLTGEFLFRNIGSNLNGLKITIGAEGSVLSSENRTVKSSCAEAAS